MNKSLEYKEVLSIFKNLIKSNGLKYTKQRELILETIYNNRGHFTPEDIYNLIKRDFPEVKVGIATIYRTLTLPREWWNCYINLFWSSREEV